MQISERAVIMMAITEGGFHIYPSGQLIELIKSNLNDKLQDTFELDKTLEKVNMVMRQIKMSDITKHDFDLLCRRLSRIEKEYDYDGEIKKVVDKMPATVELYFGLNNFKPVSAKIVDYFFENYNDLYKNADWRAFNVSDEESKFLKVPVGIYCKRSWVIPFLASWNIIHENIHRIFDYICLPESSHRYFPWFIEGIAEVMGLMMLHKILNDKQRLLAIKRCAQEIDVLDPRKATYYYGINLVAQLFRTTSLSFVRALFSVHRDCSYDIDWNMLANMICDGSNPRKYVPLIYKKTDKASFERKFSEHERKFAQEYNLNEMDYEVLNIFATMQPPATLPTDEYLAALWFNEQVTKNAAEHMVELEHDVLKSVRDVPEDVRNRTPGFHEKVVILGDAVPEKLRAGAEELGNKYFVVKREIAGKAVFDPWNGGLPWRFGCGELRCELKI